MREAERDALPALPMAPATGPRFAAIDLARGVALVGMIIYHLSFDLRYLGFTDVDPTSEPWLVGLARITAGSFLFLAGVNLVLAHRNGFRGPAFFRRLGIIVAAAAMVSVVTYGVLGPDYFIRFGILHAIAACSLLGALVLRLPALVLIVLAVAAFALPVWFTGSALDQPWLFWLGLSANPPDSVDFVPILPWLGVTLAGMAAAKLGIAAGADSWLAPWHPRNPPARLLILAGQWSLAIYLLHQPLILGILTPIAWFTPDRPTVAESTLTEDLGRVGQVPESPLEPIPDAEPANPTLLARQTEAYTAECLKGCGANGSDLATCTAYCGCVLNRMDTAGLRSRILLAPVLTEALQQRLVTFSQGCWRSLAPATPAPAPEALPEAPPAVAPAAEAPTPN